MTKEEQEAFRKGYEQAKSECLQIVDEWSRACHPTHPKNKDMRTRCWQHHGLQSAKRSIKRDVRIVMQFNGRPM